MRRLYVLLTLAALGLSCQAPDPRTAIIEERARYEVELLSWATQEDGTVAAQVRVSGPVRATLDRLTVEVVRVAEDDSIVASDWVAIDLSARQRGETVETTLFLDPRGGAADVAGIGIRLHPNPTLEEQGRLAELADVGN